MTVFGRQKLGMKYKLTDVWLEGHEQRTMFCKWKKAGDNIRVLYETESKPMQENNW